MSLLSSLSPASPLSVLEQLWALFVTFLGSEDVLIFGLLVVAVVIAALGLAVFVEFFGGSK